LPQSQFGMESRIGRIQKEDRSKGWVQGWTKTNYNPLHPPFLRGSLGREFPSDKRGFYLGWSVCQKLCKATKLSLALSLIFATGNFKLSVKYFTKA